LTKNQDLLYVAWNAVKLLYKQEKRERRPLNRLKWHQTQLEAISTHLNTHTAV